MYDAMVAAGDVTADQARQLTTTIDAGARSAAAQRRTRPEPGDRDPDGAAMLPPEGSGDDSPQPGAEAIAMVGRTIARTSFAGSA